MVGRSIFVKIKFYATRLLFKILKQANQIIGYLCQELEPYLICYCGIQHEIESGYARNHCLFLIFLRGNLNN